MSVLSYSGTIVKQSDNDRYLCSLFAPAEKREGLFALYAFNSEIAKIPETVSDPMLGLIRLQWWREAIESLYKGVVRKHEVVTDLHKALQQQPLSQALFEKLLTARESDLDDEPPATLDALIDYAEGTSSTLFQLALEVLDARNDHTDEAARHLGIAWALIGYIRAFRFHGASRRVLFPIQLLEAQQLTMDNIRAGHLLERLPAVIRKLAETSEQHLRATYALQHTLPSSALPVFLHATMASHFLSRLKKADYDILHHDLESHRIRLQLRLFVSALRGKF